MSKLSESFDLMFVSLRILSIHNHDTGNKDNYQLHKRSDVSNGPKFGIRYLLASNTKHILLILRNWSIYNLFHEKKLEILTQVILKYKFYVYKLIVIVLCKW